MLILDLLHLSKQYLSNFIPSLNVKLMANICMINALEKLSIVSSCAWAFSLSSRCNTHGEHSNR